MYKGALLGSAARWTPLTLFTRSEKLQPAGSDKCMKGFNQTYGGVLVGADRA
jgi:hypothetical protein